MTAVRVIKRDGREVNFDISRIETAIQKAFISVDLQLDSYAKTKSREVAKSVEAKFADADKVTVEEIQDEIERSLMAIKRKDVAKEYILYREERNRNRGNSTDKVIQEIVNDSNEYWSTENSNKNARVVTTQRDYIAGATSTDIARRILLPKDVVDAHDAGIIHFHDADYMAQNALTNCCLINLEDMLQNGTVINGVMIEKPHRFLTACTIATQIILGVSSSQYGGCTVSLSHLAPFVRDSYERHYSSYKKRGLDEIKCIEFAKLDTKKEIEDGVQTFNYQVNSMTNSNGQAPFLSVFMYLNETDEYKDELAMIIEEFLNQRILGFKNEQGVYITPAFPKLLYVLEEDNITKGSRYFYLTELAAKCSAKRLVPDYISEKMMKQIKVDSNGEGHCFPCMGCRSFLSPYLDKDGKPKYYGRFNSGVVTINLADVALSSKRDIDKFWELFEQRTELCHRALRIRWERVSKITSDAAPLLWQHGAFARLKKGESVEPLLHGDYSTLSLGYAALYECVKYMTGYSHTSPEGEKFALEVMEALNAKCAQWREAEDIGYSLYGSPIESTTYKFAKCLKSRFGDEWNNLTDGANYVTNSYHINVREKIDAFTKLKLESKFQALSSGGSISYVESPNMQNNIPAVIQLIQFIYNNIMYAELNTKSDYCQACGYDGEIEIKGEQGSYYWECPNCGNHDQKKLNIARRTCGYVGTNFWNQGRTEEIKERVIHLDW